jgi:hypothetical protein
MGSCANQLIMIDYPVTFTLKDMGVRHAPSDLGRLSVP